jgi:hypothetical protein
MKYEFIKKDEDITILKYKEKEYEFKTDIKIISEIQSLVADARIKLIEDYASKGKSIKDLTIEKKVNGKTYYDNTNKRELENIYQEKITIEYFDNKCKEIFNMNLAELITDIGLETEEETSKFATELISYLSGKTPSK